MRGQILQVETDGGGLILGTDGNRYRFSATDWKGSPRPGTGAEVDFIAGGSTATEVFPLPMMVVARPSEDSSVLLGTIGVLCLVLGLVIPVLPTIAAFIVGLIGADSGKRHGNATGLTLSRIAWIGALVLMLAGIVLLALAWSFAIPMFEMLLRQLEAMMEPSLRA